MEIFLIIDLTVINKAIIVPNFKFVRTIAQNHLIRVLAAFCGLHWRGQQAGLLRDLRSAGGDSRTAAINGLEEDIELRLHAHAVITCYDRVIWVIRLFDITGLSPPRGLDPSL